MKHAASPLEPRDPRELMRRSPMSHAQIIAVGVTMGLSALDGFDVLAVTLAAPGLTRDWHISHGALGAVLSAGLLGMAIGSLLLAPLADLLGRRSLLFLTLALMGTGMGMSGSSHSVLELSLWRVVTGLGIGAMIPVINPLATEFANARRRDLAVSLMAVGYPVGGVAGAGAATLLLRTHHWSVLFFLGAGLSLIAAAVVWLWLPEPLSFLVERPRSDALRRVNDLLARFGVPPVDSLPAPKTRLARQRLRDLLGVRSIAGTLYVTLLNLLYVIAVYYVLSWVPQLVADLGFSPADAASVSFAANLAGIAGGVLFGWTATQVPVRPLAAGVFAAFALLTVAFSVAAADLYVLRMLGAALGFFLFGGMCALHSIVSRSFSDHIRASGAGFVMGIGRAGSALVPVVTGLMFSFGVGRTSIALALAGGVLLAAGLALRLRSLESQSTEEVPENIHETAEISRP